MFFFIDKRWISAVKRNFTVFLLCDDDIFWKAVDYVVSIYWLLVLAFKFCFDFYKFFYKVNDTWFVFDWLKFSIWKYLNVDL